MTRKDYDSFVAEKLAYHAVEGIRHFTLPTSLFDHQRALTSWALKRGRAAIFADTGLGKARMSLSWAHAIHEHTKKPVIMLEPLAVGPQMMEEGLALGIKVHSVRDGAEIRPGINITNYERLHRFDPSEFSGVVLGESSCIKHHDAKTFDLLVSAFAETPFKLPESATPAPNDFTELGTHAEFLGICTRAEMLAEFFVHDGGETQKWRLKGHARCEFWRWVSKWGAMVRKPSDLGFSDAGYLLPELHVREHVVAGGYQIKDGFFGRPAMSLSERREARKQSIDERVAACAAAANEDRREPWVVWCDLNAESQALTAKIHGAIEVTGSMPIEEKEERLLAFRNGKARVIVTKPSIAGHGLNWQHARCMAFVGVTDSYEAYYQAVRRCWRFGQKRPVYVDVFVSEAEGRVTANLKRKEMEATQMAEALSALTREALLEQVMGSERQTNDHMANRTIQLPGFIK